MAILKIHKVGDPVLRIKSEPIKKLDNKTRELLVDMMETMRFYNGIGLAAPQIGLSKSLIVFDTSAYPEGSYGFIINPRLSGVGSNTDSMVEGCLSFPGRKIKVERSTEIEVEYYNISGKYVKEVFTGITARVIQHEIDHLSGILLPDYTENE